MSQISQSLYNDITLPYSDMSDALGTISSLSRGVVDAIIDVTTENYPDPSNFDADSALEIEEALLFFFNSAYLYSIGLSNSLSIILQAVIVLNNFVIKNSDFDGNSKEKLDNWINVEMSGFWSKESYTDGCHEGWAYLCDKAGYNTEDWILSELIESANPSANPSENPSELSLPVVTSTFVGSFLCVNIEFPQDMFTVANQDLNDFVLYHNGVSQGYADENGGWLSSRLFQILWEDSIFPEEPITMDYVKGTNPFRVLSSSQEYSSWSDMTVTFTPPLPPVVLSSMWTGGNELIVRYEFPEDMDTNVVPYQCRLDATVDSVPIEMSDSIWESLRILEVQWVLESYVSPYVDLHYDQTGDSQLLTDASILWPSFDILHEPIDMS